MKELLNKDQSFIKSKDNFNTRFENPGVAKENSARSPGKDSHRQKDEFDWGIHGRCDKYIHLNASREKIYQESLLQILN